MEILKHSGMLALDRVYRDELSPSTKLVVLIQQKPLDATLKGVWGHIHQYGIFISHDYTVGVDGLLT